MKRLVAVFLLGIARPLWAMGESAVHIVIPEGAFGNHLASTGVIARVPAGTTMRISFDYSEYDPRHPYLIADRFCAFKNFMRWGAASHPSSGQIDLVCIKVQGKQPLTPTMGGH